MAQRSPSCSWLPGMQSGNHCLPPPRTAATPSLPADCLSTRKERGRREGQVVKVVIIVKEYQNYAIKTGHIIDWSGAKVIDRNDHFYQRCLLESWHIQSNKNALNREIGTLPRVYQSLMQ